MGLHAIHAQVVAPILRVLGVDQRPRDEGAPILRPTGDDRQIIEGRRTVAHLQYWPVGFPTHANLECGRCQITSLPDFLEGRRHDGLHGVDQFFEEVLTVAAKAHFDTPGIPEQIHDEWEACTFWIAEEDGWTTGGNHPTVNLCHFQFGVNGSIHFHQFPGGAKFIKKGTQVSVHGGLPGSFDPDSMMLTCKGEGVQSFRGAPSSG